MSLNFVNKFELYDLIFYAFCSVFFCVFAQSARTLSFQSAFADATVAGFRIYIAPESSALGENNEWQIVE